jgi:hypothetical protein
MMFRCLRNGPQEFGGEAGIRTLGRAFGPYNGLANRRLQPLGHLTANCKYTARKHLPDRTFLTLPTTGFQTAAFIEFDRKKGAHFAVRDEPSGHTRGRHRESCAR